MKMTARAQAIAACSLMLACIACGSSDGYTRLDEKTFDARRLKMVEDTTGVQLPAGARGLNMIYTESFDPYLYAKIEIPESAREELEKQIGEKPSEDKNTIAGGIADSLDWWKPAKETIVEERFYHIGSDNVQLLLCKEGDRWILYATWHMT